MIRCTLPCTASRGDAQSLSHEAEREQGSPPGRRARGAPITPQDELEREKPGDHEHDVEAEQELPPRPRRPPALAGQREVRSASPPRAGPAPPGAGGAPGAAPRARGGERSSPRTGCRRAANPMRARQRDQERVRGTAPRCRGCRRSRLRRRTTTSIPTISAVVPGELAEDRSAPLSAGARMRPVHAVVVPLEREGAPTRARRPG